MITVLNKMLGSVYRFSRRCLELAIVVWFTFIRLVDLVFHRLRGVNDPEIRDVTLDGWRYLFRGPEIVEGLWVETGDNLGVEAGNTQTYPNTTVFEEKSEWMLPSSDLAVGVKLRGWGWLKYRDTEIFFKHSRMIIISVEANEELIVRASNIFGRSFRLFSVRSAGLVAPIAYADSGLSGVSLTMAKLELETSVRAKPVELELLGSASHSFEGALVKSDARLAPHIREIPAVDFDRIWSEFDTEKPIIERDLCL